MSTIDQKKIARNTLFLYLRMGLLLLISLYTSRVILDALGDVDFGIYNAVGGIVAMFSFLSGTLSTACQRFFLVEMGRGTSESLRNVFSMCLIAFAVLAAAIAAVCEPVGLWLLDNKMNVAGRMDAARIVFQCSIAAFVLSLIRLPYQGMVISREKMKVFAYISIIEAAVTLGLVIRLSGSGGDHLVSYAFITLAVQAAVTVAYFAYCRIFWAECRFHWFWSSGTFREIFSFAGWNLIGTAAGVLKIHGVNLLLNIFFGPAVNAARGLAYKIYASVVQLQENFYTASKPQIIKSYSAGEYDGMKKLVYQSAKFSSWLMLLVAVPVILEIRFLLGIWLKEVPDFTASFSVIMLVNALFDYIDYPLWVAIQARGKVRGYQLAVGIFQLMVLPVAYLLLKFAHCGPGTVLWICVAISAGAIVLRLFFARSLVGLKPSDFITRTLVPVLFVCSFSYLAGFAVRGFLDEGWLRLILVTVASMTVEGGAIWIFGLTESERKSIASSVAAKLRKG